MHYHDPIRVALRSGVPTAFTWRGRTYHIRTITDRWNRAATNPADPRATAKRLAVEPDFWHVNAAPDGGHSGMYELRYTPRTKTWHLTAADSTVSTPGRGADHVGRATVDGFLS